MFSFYFSAEYCIYDSFNPECKDGDVIVVTHALYGRMRIGKCLTENYFTGCSVNVLNLVDKFCSGKPKCNILIPNQEMGAVVNCRRDLLVYLEAGFICERGKSLEIEL